MSATPSRERVLEYLEGRLDKIQKEVQHYAKYKEFRGLHAMYVEREGILEEAIRLIREKEDV